MYPDNCTLLVDTYDTLKSGVPNAIRVFQEFKDAGKPLIKYGIRLDSGDLAYLSKEARKMLDEAGFPKLPSVLLTIWTSSFSTILRCRGQPLIPGVSVPI